MPTPTLRAFKGKDVDMLTTCLAIIENATANKTSLLSKRATWADPFLPDLKARINNAFVDVLGIDNAQKMREATQALTVIQKNAMRDLAELKVQIENDFKNNKTRSNEILNTLGFTQHLKDAQKKDQEALIELLYQFKKNMSTTLKNEIITAGTSSTQITTIIGYADNLKNSNITQETFKGSRKVVSQAGVKELNEIYNAVISVAKISAKFFKNDKAIRDQFSFSQIKSKLNQSTQNTEETPPPTP